MHVTRFLIPGIFAAILVAVLQAIGMTDNGNYTDNYFTEVLN